MRGLSMERRVEGVSELEQAIARYEAWEASRNVEELCSRLETLRSLPTPRRYPRGAAQLHSAWMDGRALQRSIHADTCG
jgi:hypothetical protein